MRSSKENKRVKVFQNAKELMDKYNVPAVQVIRHYDVTGKICPNPYA
ncbi:N-acetylmuramoyl-L-alanine amidase [Lacrimispora indolis]|nr:N-acetylmuramoyl-L-alanine amidase [Lacrimispora indolis]